MALTSLLLPGYLGWLTTATNLNPSSQLNASTGRIAFGWFQREAKVLSKLLIRVPSVTGTLGASDMVCDIFSDTGAGLPNASLVSRATVTATPTGAAWVEWTGFALSLSANTQYWAVFSNVNGTPASNFWQMHRGVDGLLGPLYANALRIGPESYLSSNSGVSWVSQSRGVGQWRLEFNDGTFYGAPIESFTAPAVGERVYSTNEWGAKFTSPAGQLSVAGVAMPLVRGGSGYAVSYRLYNGTSLLGTTVSSYNAAFNTEIVPFYFSSPVTLPASATIRVSICDPAGTSTSSNYFVGQAAQWHNDANSKTLKPWGGSCSRTFYNGSSWADTDTEVPMFWLILQPGSEALAGGGGPVGSNMRGGFVN